VLGLAARPARGWSHRPRRPASCCRPLPWLAHRCNAGLKAQAPWPERLIRRRPGLGGLPTRCPARAPGWAWHRPLGGVMLPLNGSPLVAPPGWRLGLWAQGALFQIPGHPVPRRHRHLVRESWCCKALQSSARRQPLIDSPSSSADQPMSPVDLRRFDARPTPVVRAAQEWKKGMASGKASARSGLSSTAKT